MIDRSAVVDRGVVYPAKALSRDNLHVIAASREGGASRIANHIVEEYRE
jgi:hypothetical protein